MNGLDGIVFALPALAIMVYVVSFLGIGLHGFYSSEWREHAKKKAMAETARRLGFIGSKEAIAGLRGGYRVEVRVADYHEKAAIRPEIVVSAPAAGGFIGGGAFVPPTLALPQEREADGEESADAGFDRSFGLQGLDAASLAPLDAATRDLLRQAHERGMSFRVVEGRLLLLLPAQALTAELLVSGIETALLLAARLALTAEDIPAALARNAREDRETGVRLKNLDALVAEHPTLPLTAATLRDLLGDRDRSMRCLAALHGGDPGFDALAAALREPGVDDDLAARALDRVVSGFAFERANPVIAGALGDGPEAWRTAALQAIGKTGDPAWESLARGSLAAESAEVRQAAIETLGRIGTRASVPALREIEREEPFDRLQSAAAGAIARIQANLAGAAAGQVALADADDEAGRVSLAPSTAAGRVALPAEAPERG